MGIIMNMELQFCSKVDVSKLDEIQDLPSYVAAVYIEPVNIIWNLPDIELPCLPPSKEEYTTLVEKHRAERLSKTRRLKPQAR